MIKRSLTLKTPKHKLKVDAYITFIKTSLVKVNKKLFTKMCKDGCVNYDKKFCCPPLSPEFKNYVNKSNLMVMLLKVNLDQLKKYKEYHRLRVGNVVIKSKTERMMREFEKISDTKFLSNGACRLCKPCNRKLSKFCKRPTNMRFSLEALGVDCNKLVNDLFGFELLWYKDKKAPEYTCVVCGLPYDKNLQKDLEHEISKIIV